jgi:hypothetical protein
MIYLKGIFLTEINKERVYWTVPPNICKQHTKMELKTEVIYLSLDKENIRSEEII